MVSYQSSAVYTFNHSYRVLVSLSATWTKSNELWRANNRLTLLVCRLGILSMIICLAVGIANIFSFNVVRIIFCAFAM
jgi:hypothetical protein